MSKQTLIYLCSGTLFSSIKEWITGKCWLKNSLHKEVHMAAPFMWNCRTGETSLQWKKSQKSGCLEGDGVGINDYCKEFEGFRDWTRKKISLGKVAGERKSLMAWDCLEVCGQRTTTQKGRRARELLRWGRVKRVSLDLTHGEDIAS